MSLQAKYITIALLFLIHFILGYVLARAGKPYNMGVFQFGGSVFVAAYSLPQSLNKFRPWGRFAPREGLRPPVQRDGAGRPSSRRLPQSPTSVGDFERLPQF